MKTITFYSYKGGVGRSLTLSNIAMRLADLGKKVCIIDFDLEAPGLHLKFDRYINSDNLQKGVVDYISEFQEHNVLPEKIDDFSVNIDYYGTLGGEIRLIPAGNVKNNSYWKKLSSISWKELFYSKNNYGVNLLLHFKELIRKDFNPDFILIDSRTGITDISGITMTLLSDEVVMLAANNEENISGTARVIKSLLNDENNIRGIVPKIHFVLSRIPYYAKPEDKHKEVKIIKKAKSAINEDSDLIKKVFVIHSDRGLEEEESFKIDNFANLKIIKDKEETPIEEDYLSLFEELTKNDLKKDEVSRFNDLRESEILLEKAFKTDDNALRIKLLEQAIKLNKNSDEAYALLSSIYSEIGDFKTALYNINKALNIDKNNLTYLNVYANINKGIGKEKEAINTLLKVLSIDIKDELALIQIGSIYYNKKDYKKALDYRLKLLSFYPDSSRSYNGVGNLYRALGNYDKALKYIYKCLEIKPNSIHGTATLAEIFAAKGNDDEFYKNLQLAFVFGLDSDEFQETINKEVIYRKYFEDERFLTLLENYRIKVSFPKD